MSISIGGLQKNSLLDYPGLVSCIIFTNGCNFKCGFCHNKSLLLAEERREIKQEKIFNFLRKRQGLIEAVVVTGGEPTIYKSLPDFLKKIKDLGYLIKLDTNGTNPDMIKELIKKDLLDFIAMDIKASFENYSKAAGVDNCNVEDIKKSVEIIKNFKNYEFRTTVVPGIIDKQEIKKIGDIVKGAKKHALQQFRPKNTLKKEFSKLKPLKEEKLKEFKSILEKKVQETELRGV
ncbi:MAG TPA: anaerobic ribonucleoside-triphosphate reductase activating protein [Patescibacteria group bacterium]|nr:anaerobic ribonucleoside-triphosphate reductase activating protein [Patescibacteria group bacterium]